LKRELIIRAKTFDFLDKLPERREKIQQKIETGTQ
jgi:hypothetical protein